MKKGFLSGGASLGDHRVQSSGWGSLNKSVDEISGKWTRFTLNAKDSPSASKNNKDMNTSKNVNPLKDKPFIPVSIDNPLGGLAERYKRNSCEFRQDVCVATWDDDAKVKKFTAIVTCPLSGERFASGRWRSEKLYEIRDENLENGDTAKVVWYTKKKNAQHAAAARALDCFRTREANGKPMACYGQDEPYLKPEDAPPLPSCPIPLFHLERVHDPDTSTPKNDLVTFYKECYKKEFQLDNKQFVAWSDNDLHSPHFTCIFTCPLTFEYFTSGRWKDKSGVSQIREECLEDGKVIDVVWYPSKKFAIQAAAAKALDCFRYRLGKETGNIPDFNYGNEEPYLQPDDALSLPQCPCELQNLPMISFASMFRKPNDKTEEMEIEEEQERLNTNIEYKKARMVKQ